MTFEGALAVFDFETGGYDADKNPICSVSMIIRDIHLNEIARYNNFVKPYNGFTCTKSALDFNKITLEKLEAEGISAEQLYKDMVKLFKPLVKGKGGWCKVTLAGQNISKFDINFFAVLFEIHKDSIWNYVEPFMFDTLNLFRLKYGNIDMPNYELGTLCEFMGISLTDAHDAENDTIATDHLVCKLIKELRGEGTNNVATILEEREKERSRYAFKF